ncbi:MAG: FMN-binding protein [Candidatus Microbacterium phytovorans]|uniref:FMN-binding protein n=1 Tax=Candidatus Microbacterium phytovorans TaxID=3121374 RepID=A0AAJ5VZK6_9MICO|nr:FMN-binding protein [Microbacterium sp.]WEK12518.1 MAG: FMN-binding protein [Microbacterium sp.]
MKKIVYGILATLSGLVLLFSYRTSLGDEIVPDAAAVDAPTSTAAGSTPSPSASTGSADSSSTNAGSTGGSDTGSTSASASASASDLADGSYTGDAVNTRYGPVQVAIKVSGGAVSDVQVVDYPSSNPRDRQINERAIPELVSETISAQSAEIDMVSGATYTSDGYIRSLQSALDEAAA